MAASPPKRPALRPSEVFKKLTVENQMKKASYVYKTRLVRAGLSRARRARARVRHQRLLKFKIARSH
jgi:hypothetical protein